MRRAVTAQANFQRLGMPAYVQVCMQQSSAGKAAGAAHAALKPASCRTRSSAKSEL